MDHLPLSKILQELGWVLNHHSANSIPSLTLLYGWLQEEYNLGESQQVFSTVFHNFNRQLTILNDPGTWITDPIPASIHRSPSIHGSPSPPVSPTPPPAKVAHPQALVLVNNHLCKRRGTKRKGNRWTIVNQQGSYPYGQEEGGASSEDEEDIGQQAKRSKQWLFAPSDTLALDARGVIQQLAGEGDRINPTHIVHSLLESDPPIELEGSGTLKELTKQWANCTSKRNCVQFWQAIIEMKVFLKCQR